MSAVKVLFVCMGNICRSPTGEGVFRHFVEVQGFAESIVIDSAGTIGYHTGSPADHRMQAAATQRGYSLDSLARRVDQRDISEFDLIVAMDEDNLRDLEALTTGPQPHIKMLGAFLPDTAIDDIAPSVPDPYYGGEQGFEQVLDMIESACPGIFAHCQSLLAQRIR